MAKHSDDTGHHPPRTGTRGAIMKPKERVMLAEILRLESPPQPARNSRVPLF